MSSFVAADSATEFREKFGRRLLEVLEDLYLQVNWIEAQKLALETKTGMPRGMGICCGPDPRACVCAHAPPPSFLFPQNHFHLIS